MYVCVRACVRACVMRVLGCACEICFASLTSLLETGGVCVFVLIVIRCSFDRDRQTDRLTLAITAHHMEQNDKCSHMYDFHELALVTKICVCIKCCNTTILHWNITL